MKYSFKVILDEKHVHLIERELDATFRWRLQSIILAELRKYAKANESDIKVIETTGVMEGKS